VLHDDVGFATAWDAFPVIVACCAQAEQLLPPAIAGALAVFATSDAQGSLSTPARFVRRRMNEVELTATLVDGDSRRFGGRQVPGSLEVALRAMVWGHVALAVAMLTAALRTWEGWAASRDMPGDVHAGGPLVGATAADTWRSMAERRARSPSSAPIHSPRLAQRIGSEGSRLLQSRTTATASKPAPIA
jgi:hypothetical protein